MLLNNKRKRGVELEEEGRGPAKSSRYFLTVNPHISKAKLKAGGRMKETTEEFERVMAEFLNTYLQDYIVYVNPKTKQRKRVPPDLIKGIKNHLVVEFQKQNKNKDLHAHVSINIEHWSRIQLLYQEMHEKIMEMLTGNPVLKESVGGGNFNPKIHIQRGSKDGEKERLYMEKGSEVTWTRVEVAEYYRKLRDENETDPEKWDRFSLY